MDAESFVIIAAFLMALLLIGVAWLVVTIANEATKGGRNERGQDDAGAIRS